METFAPASGWVAVLISVALAVFLPILTMAITAFCLPRTITKNSGEHWAERARSLYPFKAVRIYSLSLLPLFYATAANFYPDSFRPIPRWIFCIVIFLASFGSTNWTIWWLGRRYQLQPEPFWERLRKTAALTLLYGTIIVFAITAAALPDEWNLRCAVVLCAGILVYLPLIKFLSEFAANPEKGLPLLAWCPVIMAGFIFLNRRRRQMEVRADVFGSQVHEDKSIYARALAKLYQANETPAVMPRKSMPHPHLYDRLRVAGITPDFPRPGPSCPLGYLGGAFGRRGERGRFPGDTILRRRLLGSRLSRVRQIPEQLRITWIATHCFRRSSTRSGPSKRGFRPNRPRNLSHRRLGEGGSEAALPISIALVPGVVGARRVLSGFLVHFLFPLRLCGFA